MTTPIPRILQAIEGWKTAEEQRAIITANAIGRLFGGGKTKEPARIQDPKAAEAVLLAWAQTHNTR